MELRDVQTVRNKKRTNFIGHPGFSNPQMAKPKTIANNQLRNPDSKPNTFEVKGETKIPHPVEHIAASNLYQQIKVKLPSSLNLNS